MEGPYDELLAEQAKALEKMDEDRRQLLDRLGMSEAQLTEAINDPSRFPPGVWKALQKYRQALELLIDSKISTPKKPRKSSSAPHEVKGHWIFVK